MDCEKFYNAILECLENRLPGNELTKLKKHLESCGTCMDHWVLCKSLRRTMGVFYEWRKQPEMMANGTIEFHKFDESEL